MTMNKKISFTLNSNNPELKKVMLNVRKQVLRYETAKKEGTLKKVDQVASRLF
jgi:hypothetical protein